MKIVIDARTMGSKPSGIGIYAFNYIKELMKSEHKLVLLTDVAESQEMQFLRNQGIQIICYGPSVYRSAQVLKYFAFVRKELNRIQPDLFWEPNILIPRKLNGYSGKIMITIHDMFPVTHVQYFGWKYGMYFRYVLKKTIQMTDIILYDSIETRKTAEQFCPSARQKKTFVQYVIVPKEGTEEACATEAATQELDTQASLTQEYFLYVGNMEKRKGVDLLLDAYEAYREKGGSRMLVLAGKSRERDIDEKIASMVKKYKEVVYYGYVSEADKRHLYQNCACFLFPSMAEGFGICVVEAMNYYKPIIVSDLSIFREIVGECISYFSLDGGRPAQIEELSRAMLEFSVEIDRNAYDEAMGRYAPEKLGKNMLDILREAD